MARGHRDRVRDHRDQPSRSGERFLGARGDDPVGDATGEPLLTVNPQDARQVGGGPGVHDGRCRGVGVRIHPHVQRRVHRVGEAALGPIDLQRRKPEIEADGLHLLQPCPGQDVREFVVDRVVQLHPVTEAGQPLPRQREGVRVAVDADQPGVRAGLEQELGVSAHAQGSVHVHRTGSGQCRAEEFDDASGHHGHVQGRSTAGHFAHACHPLLIESCDVVSIRSRSGAWHRGRCARYPVGAD